jgi:putative ABC transport system permease protein
MPTLELTADQHDHLAKLRDELAAVTGFEGLVQVPAYAYVAGAGVAFGFALLGGTLGAWRVGRVASVSALER